VANDRGRLDDIHISGISRERLAVFVSVRQTAFLVAAGQQLIEEFTMKLKRIAAGAAVAGALGFASIGIGAGQAQADDWCWWGWCNVPPPPGQFVPSPGHIGQ
jgi:hypothetical protein